MPQVAVASHVAVACQAVIAVTFAMSAFSKLRTRVAYRQFRQSLVRLRLVGVDRAQLIAVPTVGLELLASVAVAVPATRTLGFTLAAGQLVVFTGVIVRTIRRGSVEPCRCFGASDRPLGGVHLVRNGVLSGFAMTGGTVAVLLDPVPPTVPGVALAVVAGGITAVLLARADDLADLFHSPVSNGSRPRFPDRGDSPAGGPRPR